jgi:hypothetical protein
VNCRALLSRPTVDENPVDRLSILTSVAAAPSRSNKAELGHIRNGELSIFPVNSSVFQMHHRFLGEGLMSAIRFCYIVSSASDNISSGRCVNATFLGNSNECFRGNCMRLIIIDEQRAWMDEKAPAYFRPR